MKILVYDIETFLEFFLIGVYIPSSKEYYEFCINKNANDLYKFIKFAEEYEDYYWVGFNNLSFDNQVLEWILRTHEKWVDLSRLETAAVICRKAEDIIDNSNHRLRPYYSEFVLTLKPIDLFKIHHLNNENKRTSLKWCEFMMDFESIEDMPIHYLKEELTDEEIEGVKFYCKNDVMATYRFYLWTIGECDNPEYKGKNKIQDRLNLMVETGMPCLNWSDVTIGEEWNRKDYTELTGRKGRDLYPRKVRHFFGMQYNQFFPNTVEFQSEKVRKFVVKMGETRIIRMKGSKKQMFKLELGGMNIAFGKGGLHSSEKPRYIPSTEGEEYIQVDIGSQYPNAYKKLGIYPKHLGKAANTIAVRKIKRRLDDKALYKRTKDTRYKSLEEMGKLALNGGLYGKLKQKGSFLEDHVCQLQITMCCQLEILMIVEALVLKGFRVVSVNTDGFDVVVARERMQEFKDICAYYEEKIGNSGEGNGNLEFTPFEWIAQLSVSSYLAKKEDGELKKKKEFNTDFLVNENKSRRITALALEAYFNEGVYPETFITNHKNIFDFCIGVKSGKDYCYKTGDNEIIDERTTRYYISKDGVKLYKIKREGSDAKGNDIQECEAPEEGRIWLCTIANRIDKAASIESYNIDYEYYIRRANKIIAQIHVGKKIVKKVNPNQTSLF